MPTFELTAAQQAAMQVMRGRYRHILGVGGSRSGKTFLLVRGVIVRALRAERSRHAIMRYRYNAVRQSIGLDTLPKVCSLCFPGLTLNEHRQDGYFTLPNKSEIWLGGLDEKDRVEKILGQEYATIYYNECSQIPYDSVVIAQTRLAQQCDGLANRAYYDLNPTTARHWTHQVFFDHKDPISKASIDNPEDYATFRLNPQDNAQNLDPAYIASLERLPERQRKRFFEGVYGSDTEGALWPPGSIDEHRRTERDVPELQRVVVAVDPSGASGEADSNADEIGIVAAGRDRSDQQTAHAYVLEDGTARLAPEQWARKAIALYHKHGADRIVAEKNFGGDMVRAVIHGVDRNVPVDLVTASRGKAVRAEPVASLYSQGRVHHVGRYPDLEDEMEQFSTAGYLGASSPNRADAMVWAVTDLLLGSQPEVYVV